MSIICIGFLIATYIASLVFNDLTYTLFGIGCSICWYLDSILKELKKK